MSMDQMCQDVIRSKVVIRGNVFVVDQDPLSLDGVGKVGGCSTRKLVCQHLKDVPSRPSRSCDHLKLKKVWFETSKTWLKNIDQSSIINHQSSIINHQSSIINHQSSIINHQPSIINHQSSIINHQSSIINHQSSTINADRQTVKVKDLW